MSHVPHELAEEFPDQVQQLHDLKMSNTHFQNLANEYHEVNREIHRIESGVEGASELRERDLRKRRMSLKDEIARMMVN